MMKSLGSLTDTGRRPADIMPETNSISNWKFSSILVCALESIIFSSIRFFLLICFLAFLFSHLMFQSVFSSSVFFLIFFSLSLSPDFELRLSLILRFHVFPVFNLLSYGFISIFNSLHPFFYLEYFVCLFFFSNHVIFIYFLFFFSKFSPSRFFLFSFFIISPIFSVLSFVFPSFYLYSFSFFSLYSFCFINFYHSNLFFLDFYSSVQFSFFI